MAEEPAAPEAPSYEARFHKAAEMLAGFHEPEAMAILLPMLEERQDDVRVYALLGEAALNLRKFKQAVSALKIARLLDPDNLFIDISIANAFTGMGQLVRARKILDRLRPAFIGTRDAPMWAWSMAEVVGNMGDAARAEALLEYCIQEVPTWAVPWGAMGKLKVRAHRYAEAVECFQQQWKLKPTWTSAHDLGMHLPFVDHWTEAYDLWHVAGHMKHEAAFGGAPQWGGEPVGVLGVYGDGGLGDTIQYSRYLMAALRTCKRVLFYPQVRHLDVVRRLELPGIEVMENVTAAAYDAATWLMLLPGECSMPYPSQSPAVSHFRGEPKVMPHPAVAITWAGDQEHANDKLRSARLKDFAPLVRAFPWVHWFTVAPGNGIASEIRKSALPITQCAGTLVEACDWLASADAYVGVDTGHAHVAATCGIPTHILFREFVDSRWGAHGVETGYYASVRLYRSYEDGWAPSLDAVIANLGSDPCVRKP